jgi:hypothetical protein
MGNHQAMCAIGNEYWTKQGTMELSGQLSVVCSMVPVISMNWSFGTGSTKHCRWRRKAVRESQERKEVLGRREAAACWDS